MICRMLNAECQLRSTVHYCVKQNYGTLHSVKYFLSGLLMVSFNLVFLQLVPLYGSVVKNPIISNLRFNCVQKL